jgi:chromosome partitioning protein
LQVVTISSRKGGAGKTHLARHLAVEAERLGLRVALIDADPMRGLTQWWEARAAETPPLIALSAGLPAAVETARRMGVAVLFIDTPPSAGDVVEAAVAVADLIVVPVRPSPDDLRAVGSTVEIARRARRRMVFVINQTKPRVRLTGQAAILLSQHGTVAPTMIADRTVYAASGTDGRTASEIDPNGEAAKEIAATWAYLADRMTEDFTP